MWTPGHPFASRETARRSGPVVCKRVSPVLPSTVHLLFVFAPLTLRTPFISGSKSAPKERKLQAQGSSLCLWDLDLKWQPDAWVKYRGGRLRHTPARFSMQNGSVSGHKSDASATSSPPYLQPSKRRRLWTECAWAECLSALCSTESRPPWSHKHQRLLSKTLREMSNCTLINMTLTWIHLEEYLIKNTLNTLWFPSY